MSRYFDQLDALIPDTVPREAAMDSLSAGEVDGAITALMEDAFSAGELPVEAFEIAYGAQLDTPFLLIIDALKEAMTKASPR
ncbi:hypothetical protein ACXM2N_04100 [Corynebacterium sp. ZY180755]